MFERILIARRGEVAVRIARTCKRLGLRSVALRAEGEEPGDLVDAADDVSVVPVSEDGRVSPEAIVEVARETGVDAVHPGYAGDPGHLALARALEAADVLLVGMDPDMLELVAERLALRSAAERAGVRTVPGAEAPVATLSEAYDVAHALGFPLAVRGGASLAGARDEEMLKDAWERVRETVPEGGLGIERDLPRARRIRVLIAGDANGELLPVVDREASVVPEGAVMLEECPSPELFFRADGEALREMLFDASLRLGKELSTAGLVSVDFLVDEEGRGWLDAATLGLPALHGAIERVTGQDLVELQLRLAAGEALPETLRSRAPRGHAFAAAVRSRAGLGEMRFAGAMHV
ncbi:MAG: biotin carboxylase N-terminal domain-containing protein, partial [Myxococcota bacterium]